MPSTLRTLAAALLPGALLAIAVIVAAPSMAEGDSEPPVADAGPDIEVNNTTAAVLDGSASTDDTGVVNWTWSLVDNGTQVVLEGANVSHLFFAHGVYEVTLRVADAAGNWDTDTLKVTVVSPPAAPTGLITMGWDGWMDLRWDPPGNDGGSPVLGYAVFLGVEGENLTFSRWAGEMPYAWWPNMTNGVTYQVAVAAVNEVGFSPASVIANVTPMAVPEVPNGFTLELVDGVVHMSWSAPNGSSGHFEPVGYKVYRGTDPELLEPIADLELVFEYVDLTVEDGRRYYYAVGAWCEQGHGNLTDLLEADLTEGDDDDEGAPPWLVPAIVVMAAIPVAYGILVERRRA